MVTIRAPHDQQVLGEVPDDSPATIDEKVRAAAEAMRGWSVRSAMERAEALLAIAADAEAERPELARDLSLEQGKTVKEADLELERFIGPFRQYAGLAAGSGGAHVQLGEHVAGFVSQEPVGVVAGIVPWNFPTSLFASKLAPALAAGCGFVIKPAETTPLITRRLADLAARHLPAGLLSVVTGGAAVGMALIDHPTVARVAFTGSTAVGKKVGSQALAGLKRVSLELGGSDPFVLCEDAELRPAVRSLMGTRFYNAGQVCVAPKRLIVRHEIRDDVVQRLAERLDRVRPGPGLAEGSTMGPLHTERGREVLEAQIADAADKGAEVIGGGRPDGAETANGWFLRPAIVLDPPPDARVRTEETFGPVLPVITVRDDAEAVAVANETSYSLGAAVWSASHGRALGLARQIPAGYTWVNTLGRVYDELPFGGVGESGIGREHGPEALASYLEPRTVVYGLHG